MEHDIAQGYAAFFAIVIYYTQVRWREYLHPALNLYPGPQGAEHSAWEHIIAKQSQMSEQEQKWDLETRDHLGISISNSHRTKLDVFLVAQVRSLKGISALVQLFSSENQEVQRYATGATRNLIYENMDNKTALIEAGGISKLIGALREPDDELRKNITGMFVRFFSVNM